MKARIQLIKSAGWLVLLLATLLLAACSEVVQRQQVPATEQSGSFNLFLQPLPQESDRLAFTLAELVALKSDGREIPLQLAQPRFVADQLIGVQSRLLSLNLPPGRYQGVAFRIATAEVFTETGAVALLPPAERLLLNHPFSIDDEQAETLFISLSPERLVTDGALFTPKFSLWKPERTLTNLKGFVSNHASGSLTVFNKRTSQVLSRLRVGEGPTDMVLDQQRNWLYVALAGEDAIAVVQVDNGTILGRVSLRFGDRPSDLELTRDSRTLVCLNLGSRSVSIIDTGSLFETGRLRLQSPANDLFLDPIKLRAYTTHAGTSSLSVLELQPPRLLGELALDESPLAGVAASNGRTLFLVNEFAAELSVLDAASLQTTGRVFVGDGGQTLKLDSATGLLYVGRQTGEIAVVDPRSLMAIDSYQLPAAVADMTIDNEENALFVVLPSLSKLLKLDLISKKELGRAELELDNRAVVVMGER
jgi:DNA-binding beta-propeller fold protein YncE